MLSTQNKNKYGGSTSSKLGSNSRKSLSKTPTQKPLEKPKKINPVSELPEILAPPISGGKGEEPKKNMYTYI